MTHKLKADLVAIFHLCLVLLGIVSLPLMYIFDYWYYVVFILIGLSVFSWIVYRTSCWVTDWENHYRKKSGDGRHYEIGFLKHYVKKVFGINGTSLVINIILYGYVVILIVVAVAKAF